MSVCRFCFKMWFDHMCMSSWHSFQIANSHYLHFSHVVFVLHRATCSHVATDCATILFQAVIWQHVHVIMTQLPCRQLTLHSWMLWKVGICGYHEIEVRVGWYKQRMCFNLVHAIHVGVCEFRISESLSRYTRNKHRSMTSPLAIYHGFRHPPLCMFTWWIIHTRVTFTGMKVISKAFHFCRLPIRAFG